MPKLPKLAAKMMTDFGAAIQVSRLNEGDLRSLMAAFLQDYPALAYGYIANINVQRIAPELALLIESTDIDQALNRCGTATILLAIRDALFENEDLRRDLQDALDLQWSNRGGVAFENPNAMTWRQAN